MGKEQYCEHCGHGPTCVVCGRDDNAVVVRVDEADWPVVERYLDKLGGGGILVPPEVAAQIEAVTGKDFPKDRPVRYDFAGEADVWVDVARSVSGYAASAIIRSQTGVGK